MCANLLYRGFFVINYREILRLHAQEITQSGIALGSGQSGQKIYCYVFRGKIITP